jgi:hypothetical protein
MVTTSEVYSDLTQEEKRHEMEQDRKARTTFKDFASAFANEGRGGRFAKSSDDQAIKPLPPNSPWSGAQPSPGDELPLGYDINAVPDLGFPKSVAPTPDPLAVETATDERGGAVIPPDSAPSPSTPQEASNGK